MKIRIISSVILLLLLPVVCWFFCKTDSPDLRLQKKGRVCFVTDGVVSTKDWDDLVVYLKTEKQADGPRAVAVTRFFKDGNFDCVALRDWLLGLNSKKPPTVETRCDDGKKPAYNVFIENSGSMDGYVKGKTSFESAILNLLLDVNLNRLSSSLNLFYINTKPIVFQYQADQGRMEQFVDKLEPDIFRIRGGDRNNTFIDLIFKQIIGSVNPDTLGLLISDCLLSIKGEDAIDEMNMQSSKIRGALGELLLRGDYGVIVLRLKSKFDGSFYDKLNTTHSLRSSSSTRPYFIWLFGENNDLNRLQDKVDLSKIKGGVEQILRFKKQKSGHDHDRWFHFLAKTNGASPFRTDHDDDHKISELKKGADGQYHLTLLVDAEGLPIDDGYWKEPVNFSVSPASLQVIKVERATAQNIDRMDKAWLDKHSNAFLISLQSADGSIKPHGQIDVSLKRGLPKWVTDFSTDDDTDIETNPDELDKSFGLKYLIEGAFDAFYPNTHEFFTLTLKID